MGKDPRVDAFIAKAEPFARPILEHLRALVHASVPGADETIKWGMPHFTLEGKTLCGIGAFKAHCALVVEDAGDRGGEGMGHFGKIKSLEELPEGEVLRDLLQARAGRIRSGEKLVAAKAPKPEIPVPGDLAAALTPEARAFLDGLAPSHRREYLEWIVTAKRPDTRTKRIAEAVARLEQGKKRYMI